MVNTIIGFVITYRLDLIILIASLILIYAINVVLIKYDSNGKLRMILVCLCIEAEKYLGSSTGELKKQQVISWLFLRYPILGLFLSVNTISYLIDEAVEYINNYLTKNNATLEGLEDSLKR